MFRLFLTGALVLVASVSHASPELLFNQVIGGSQIDDPVRAGISKFFSVHGPDFGIARYNLFTGWTLIEAPPFVNGSSVPFEVGARCFFRGTPMYSDGLTRLYVVDGNNALELAAATDRLRGQDQGRERGGGLRVRRLRPWDGALEQRRDAGRNRPPARHQPLRRLRPRARRRRRGIPLLRGG